MASTSGSAKIARRYAKALGLLCDERRDAEAVRQALQGVVDVLVAAPDAMAFLNNPTLALEQRAALLRQVLAGLKVEGTAQNFALLMLENGRIGALPRALAEFVAMQDARSGRAAGVLTSAVALTPATQKRIAAAIKRLLGKDVQLTAAVDPELLGGVVVRVGNTVWDSSVRNHLNRLHGQLVTD